MNILIVTKIWYNFSRGMFYIKTDTKDYEGHMKYSDDQFIFIYFSEHYILEFKDEYVVKEWLEAIIEKYYFSTEKLSLNYEALNKDLPFISFNILSVKVNEYLIKINSIKEVFNYDINNYYIAHMYSDLRSIRLLYNIGDGKILKNKKEEIFEKYKNLHEEIIRF